MKELCTLTTSDRIRPDRRWLESAKDWVEVDGDRPTPQPLQGNQLSLLERGQ